MSADRLALLAHELRSPVAALAGLAERADPELPAATLRRMLTLAVAAGRDIERMLRDYDVLSIQPVRVDVQELLAGVARPRVTVQAESVELVCDPTRVRQVLANLVDNGLRHGRSVTVDARRDGDVLLVEVSDDGPGVARDVDPFERGVSGAGSTGYGLWLARAIAEAHGGRLALHPDRRARGATFRLSLPLSEDAHG